MKKKLPLLIELPIKLVNGSNVREHWRSRDRRCKAHRSAATMIPLGLPLPVVVTVTRVAPRALDAHDNLPISCKHLVDGIAARLGVLDNDPRVTWKYDQCKGQPQQYSAMVRIEARGDQTMYSGDER